jgi:hypothetical protein
MRDGPHFRPATASAALRTRKEDSILTQQPDIGPAAAYAPVLVSHIPDEHPAKLAVEEALRRVLGSYNGEWQCRIDPSPNRRGWSLRLFGVGDHSSLVLVVRPEQQDAETVASWVTQILDRRRTPSRPQAPERRRESAGRARRPA